MSAEIQSIEIQIQQTPSCALTDPQKKAELYAFLENEIAAFEPDLETDKGRKAIAALAYKIARTKTAIDDAGADLKAEWLKKSQAIDAGRREIRDRLDVLKEKAREPLTKWENDEEQRQTFIARAFEDIRNAAILSHDDTVTTVTARLVIINNYPLDVIIFRDQIQSAIDAKIAAAFTLRKAISKLEEDEFDRQELARLREIQAKRDEEDRIAAEQDRLAKEAEERRQIVKKTEEERVKREADAIAKAKQQAEEQTRRDLELRHTRELNALREAQERNERARLAEEKRKQDEADRRLAEEKKLAASKRHRAAVTTAAENAIKKIISSQADSVAIVAAIVAGKIPAVSINFGSQS